MQTDFVRLGQMSADEYGVALQRIDSMMARIAAWNLIRASTRTLPDVKKMYAAAIGLPNMFRQATLVDEGKGETEKSNEEADEEADKEDGVMRD